MEVSERGKLIALLVPPSRARSVRDRLVADGRLIPATNPTGRLRSPHPVRISSGEPTNQQLLDTERAERL